MLTCSLCRKTTANDCQEASDAGWVAGWHTETEQHPPACQHCRDAFLEFNSEEAMWLVKPIFSEIVDSVLSYRNSERVVCSEDIYDLEAN